MSVALASMTRYDADLKLQKMILLLLDHGASADRNFANLEHFSCYPVALLKRLFSVGLGADSHTSLSRDMFLLQVAAREGKIDVIKQLLADNLDIHCHLSAKEGGIALQKAVEGGSRDIVEFLLSKGADVNWPADDNRGATALQRAALIGSMPIFSLLLDRGADVNAPAAKTDGRTALEAAAEHGRLGMVYMLLARDTRPDTLELRCKKAAGKAVLRDYSVVATVLREWTVTKSPDISGAAMAGAESDYVSPSTFI